MILCDQTLNSFQFNLSNSVNAGIESYVAGQGFNIGALSWVLNQWYHVVISRTNGVIKFYRNASEINQYSNNASIGQSTTLTIGKRDYATVHRFLGGIDDLYIWNRGLTPAEIDMLYLGLSLTASNTAPYVGETVQFNSTGSDAIIAWHWDFENDGSYDSDEPNPVHIYTDPGTYSVFLKVDYSTFSDSVLVEDYIAVTYCPPSEPENLQVTITPPHALVTWDPVSTNLLGIPITPSGYIVLFSEDPAQSADSFYYLSETPELSYSHYRVAEFRQNMFYAAQAYINYDREAAAYIEKLRASREKTPWTEIKARLYGK